MFTEGFEKEAGFKHFLTAALMAASPAKAHASSSVADALKTTGRALQNTDIGKQTSSNVNQYLKKAQNIKLFGNAPAAASGAGAAAGSAVKSGGGPSLSIRDGKQLQLNYGKFQGTADAKEVKANYDLGKGFSVGGSRVGRENKAGVLWKKDF